MTALGGAAAVHADGAAAGDRRRSGGAALGVLCRRPCRLHVRQRQRHAGRSDARVRGIASAGGVTGYGTFFGGVQAGYEHFFAVAADARASKSTCRSPITAISRRSCPIARRAPARPTNSSNIWQACAAAPATPWARGHRSSPAASPGRARATRAPTSPPATRTPTPAISGWATCWAAASTIASIHAGRRGPNISTPTSD